MNLVVALMSTEQGLTKQSILGSVSGYREQADAGASRDALEKMFERDKENLRGLGVPIETIGDRADPDDLRDARYRVPISDYAVPEDVTFTPDEIALLILAGGVWSESSMSSDARSGLRKIRSIGDTVDAPIIGYAPRLSTPGHAFAPLQRGIEAGRVVTFAYLKPGEDAARTRRVRPLALVEYDARWHVLAFDLDQRAERTFLLSRITGPVATTRGKFNAVETNGAGERALRELRDLAARQRALVEVHPGTEAALRLGRRAEAAPQGWFVPFVDVHVLADELASYGPEVRVVAPAALRDLVIDRLRAVRDLHTTSGRSV